MGIGDELMAMGVAENIHRKTGLRVAIVDRDDQPRWSEVWEHNPAIATPAEGRSGGVARYVDCPGHRAYIAGWSSWGGSPRLIFASWRIRDYVPKIHLTEIEASAGEFYRKMNGKYVVIQPSIKQGASPNKNWGWHRYQALVNANSGVRFVQLVRRGDKLLSGVKSCETETFRATCAILSRADAYVGPEGGMHHAAGCLRIPAVVVFGGFISAESTGYPWHRNVTFNGKDHPCGRWAPCPHCQEGLGAITVDRMTRELGAAIRKEPIEWKH